VLSFVNGSFETGPSLEQPGLGFDSYTAGSTAINNWLVTGQGIDYIFTFWQASNGQRSLDLNSLDASGVQQTFAVNSGATYKVFFDMAGNFESGPTVKLLKVSAAGQSANFSFDTTGKSKNNMGWITREFTFTANAPTVTLAFESQSGSGWGPALDNVRVDDLIPEPSALALVSLIVIAAGRRSRTARC
jgi:choice-of-anchor C domain-containing protein